MASRTLIFLSWGLVLLQLHSATQADFKYASILSQKPSLSYYDLAAPISGLVTSREELRQMPRAIVGYISEKEWAFIEFLCFMHASWR